MLSSRNFLILFAVLFSTTAVRSQTTVYWNGATPDFTMASSWAGPLVNDTVSSIVAFNQPTFMAPVLSTPYSVAGVKFFSGSGSNTISGTGTLTIGAWGVVNDSTDNQVISVPVAIAGSTLTLGGTGANGSINGSISGVGGVTKTGSGTWTLTGVNSYAGTTVVQDGMLYVATNDAIPSGTNVTIDPVTASQTTLDFAGTKQTIGNLTFSGVSGANSVVDLGPGGQLVLAGDVFFNPAGSTQTAEIRNGDALTLGGLSRTFSTSNTLIIQTPIVGSAELVKTGAGKLILAGDNAYAGGTRITAGVLQVGVAAGNGSIVGDVINDSNLEFANPTDTTYSGVISGAGSVVVSGSITFTGNSTYTGQTTIQPGASLSVGDGGISGAVAGPITTYGELSFNRSDAISVGNIAGSGVVSQRGTGTLTLTGTNAFQTLRLHQGTVTDFAAGSLSPTAVEVGAGTLSLGFDQSIAVLKDASTSESGTGGSVVIAPGATLSITTGRTDPFSGDISGGGNLRVTFNSDVFLTGNVTLTGVTRIESGGSIHLGNGGASGMISSPIVLNGSLSVDNSGVVELSGVSGTGQLRQIGSGTLKLPANSSFAGTTYITDGIVTNLGTGAFGTNGTAVMDGGTLDLQHSESLALRSAVKPPEQPQAAPGTVTVAAGAALTLRQGGLFTGEISGAGSLVVSPFIFQTINGSVSLTGGTTIKGGLRIEGFSNSDLGVLNIQPSAGGYSTVELQGWQNLTSGINVTAVSNAGAEINLGEYSTLFVNGDVIVSGAEGFNGFRIANGSVSWTGDRVFNVADSTVADRDMVLASEINGGGLTKTGTGTLVLSNGGNEFAGPITVNAGTLALADGAAGNATVTMNSGTTLAAADSHALIIGNVSLAGDVRFDSVGDKQHDWATIDVRGATLLQNAVTTLELGEDVSLEMSGGLIGPANTAVSFSGPGRAVLIGTTSPDITSIVASNGSKVLFTSDAAVPVTGTIGATTGGYVGVVRIDPDPFAGVQPPPATPWAVMGRITDRAGFAGTFGFDSYEGDDKGPVTVYSESLDFSAFTNSAFRIGSSTTAVLTGRITPPPTGYRFGNGGGVLIVKSNLTGPHSVSVVSDDSEEGLLTVLAGTNRFSGGLTISNSAVILASPSALPVGQPITMGGTISYLGASEAFDSAANFLTRAKESLLPYGGGAVIGIDSQEWMNYKLRGGEHDWGSPSRTVTDALDLSGFNPIALGTFTNVNLTGVITAPSRGTLTLTSFGDGALAVRSDLVAGNLTSLVIGLPTGESDGTIVLSGANTYSGGTTLQSGTVVVEGNSALGTGTVTVDGAPSNEPPAIAAGKAGAIVSNPINLISTLRLGLFPGGDHDWMDLLETMGNELTLSGAISGTGGLVVGSGRTTLGGTNTYSGRTEAWSGQLFFGAPEAISPSSTLAVFESGYVGLKFDTNAADFNLQSGFLDHFDRRTSSGTIGFDSPAGTQLTFSGPINLSDPDGTGPSTGLRVWLGSASRATLTGTITPNLTAEGDDYRFGGGGGLLDVASPLTGDRDVIVDSTGKAPLTLRISGNANTYTGFTKVLNSAVIFASGSLPSGLFEIESGAYIGTEDTTPAGVSSFITKFPSASLGGTIGFDAAPETAAYTISSNLDLSPLMAPYSVGTTTKLVFTPGASITLPAGALQYWFAPYKDGQIEVGMDLANRDGAPTDLVIGTETAPVSLSSRVTLSGTNTYTGETTLYAGNNLVLASAGALPAGSPVFVIESKNLGHATLSSTVPNLTIVNPIDLGASLEITGVNGMTLSGDITGAAGGDTGIFKSGTGLLTLTGANSFEGGVNLIEGSIAFGNATATGAGPLRFLGNGGPLTATFNVSAEVEGVFSGSAADSLVIAPGATLTVDQQFDSKFDGSITSTGASIVYKGSAASPSQLWLSGANAYNGGTEIQAGIVVIASNNHAFGDSGTSANVVTLAGGKLAANSNVTVSNRLVLQSGELGGFGSFQAYQGTGFEINGTDAFNGVALSPGINGVGTMIFDGMVSGNLLTLGSYGQYNWQMMDATNPNGGWDHVAVNGGVGISATAAAPFFVNVLSISSDGTAGPAVNFDPNVPNSWRLVTAATPITGFDQSVFQLNSSGFAYGGPGQFYLSLSADQRDLMLNFTPIPEPSTYALMIAGLGLTFFVSRRRRKV